MSVTGHCGSVVSGLVEIIFGSRESALLFVTPLILGSSLMGMGLYRLLRRGRGTQADGAAAGLVPPRHFYVVTGGILAAAMAVGLIWPQRPSSLSLDFNSRVLSPSMTRLVNKDRVLVDNTASGRSQTGGMTYAHWFTDRMDFEVLWYDVLEERAWRAEFSVWARELSAYDDQRRHVPMRITVGPGSDVTVETSSPERLRLIRLRQTHLLTPEKNKNVILRQICATPFPVDDPHVQDWITRVIPGDPYDLQERLKARERYLAKGNTDIPHCPTTGENR